MTDVMDAPKRRIDLIKDLLSHYETLAAKRPLSKEEQGEATERYLELLHDDAEPMSEERRKELVDQYDSARKDHLASVVARLVTDDQRAAMTENGRRIDAGEDIDPIPVVRLFSLHGPQSWILTELRDGDAAYGLCDLGIGQPECGEVSLTWLAEQCGCGQEYLKPSPYTVQRPHTVHTRMPIERDPHFPRRDTPTLSFLDRAASAAGKIVI